MAQTKILANGISDADGNLTVTFPSQNVNSEFSGAVSIPSAPATAQIAVVLNETTVATIGGSSQYGTLQLNSTDVLTLVATGMAADTQYQAVGLGMQVVGTVGQIIPTPTTSAVTAALTGAVESYATPPGQLASFTGITGGTPTPAIPIASSVRTLLVEVTGPEPITNLNISGPSGYTYYNDAPYLNGSAFVICNFLPVLDTSVKITASGASYYDCTIWADNFFYQESDFYNGQPVQATTYLLAAGTLELAVGPCRLLTASLDSTDAYSQITVGGVVIMENRPTTTEGIVQPLSFPQPYIVGPGVAIDLVQVGAGTSRASISTAYP